MPKILDIETRVATVGPTAADRILTKFSYPRQRKVMPVNVKRLSNELLAERYVDGTAITLARLPDGRMWMLNGYHTMTAVRRTGVSIRLTIIILSVASEQDANDIYSTFDLHRGRTWADAVRAAGLDNTIPMTARILPALGIIGGSFKFRSDASALVNSRHVRLKLLEDYQDEATLIQSALVGAPKMNVRALQRSPILAVALETAKYQPPRAFEFWRGTAADDGLSAADPRKTLLRFLLSNPLSGGSTQLTQHAKAASLAWNAWYRGGDLTMLKASGSGFVLAGTPWGTKREPAPMANELYAEDRPQPQPTPEAPDVLDLFSWGRMADQDGLRDIGFAHHTAGRA